MIMTENSFVMKRRQILYLIFISGVCSFTVGSSDFHLIDLSKTYEEAKSYCREMYTDLATVHNSAEMNNLITLVSTSTARAWIGLEAGDVWMWHWSWPDQKVDFLNWKAGEPQTKNQDACVAMDQHGEWFESDCGTKRSFVCRGSGETSGLAFVADTKSWRDAQNHCRGLSSDLVSIHSEEENEAVQNVSVSQNVWIGLFKDPWKWSDGSNSSFRYWKPFQPNYLEDQDCAAAIFKDKGQWNDLKCGGKRNFVCRGAKKTISTTTSQTSTQETFTIDQLPTNITTLQSISPQEIGITFNFTVVASTKQPNNTNVTTEEETTPAELTATNTTDVVHSASSTELNNATTEMSTSTATELPPSTNVQVTTDGIFASTTLVGTSAQNTTQLSTLMSTENTQSLPSGNLILIQQNMTWIEAMSYCREHYIDLVHITTKEIQDKVAEKVKNATSQYVWLGLRYTCKFNFWFWTRSTTGCYQNWALGQGSEGKYDCGVTGAIEATGRQQWVGLPETEKLNFICYACAG
ncbi:macrophage mannose receptor 1 isoform X1 [Toxotes jaculatrix]|uniref:macrophage mannose receptor 1 isoform X1 n=1 Tax=Toxotes jaculatrix TaxID=941984 RepID=UPI001B3A8470|nr:macrophage mannose receptor 1 isoform X1 [Toxotes jaculatrix]